MNTVFISVFIDGNIPNKADYLYTHLCTYDQRNIQKNAHQKGEDFYL